VPTVDEAERALVLADEAFTRFDIEGLIAPLGGDQGLHRCRPAVPCGHGLRPPR
jgi:hypothetical protein